MGEGIPQKVSLHHLFTANVYDGGCKRLRWRLQTFAGKDANVCGEKRQCTARTDAVHCGDGCSALRERLQCTASEMGKTGTEIASPILDKRTGRRDAPVAPWKYLLNRKFLGLPEKRRNRIVGTPICKNSKWHFGGTGKANDTVLKDKEMIIKRRSRVSPSEYSSDESE